MLDAYDELRAVQNVADLEGPLHTVEERLGALALALHRQDAEAVDRVAAELHRALAVAVEDFGHAARNGGVPPLLRHRLAIAGGQVAAQREALARATAALDRAIDVLIPRAPPAGLYGTAGAAERAAQAGSGLLV